MAILTDADYRQLREGCYQLGQGKEELNALTGGLPNSVTFRAVFQRIEDVMTIDGIPAAAVGSTIPQYCKARVEQVIGQTISLTLFRKLFRVWLRWRDQQGG